VGFSFLCHASAGRSGAIAAFSRAAPSASSARVRPEYRRMSSFWCSPFTAATLCGGSITLLGALLFNHGASLFQKRKTAGAD
jgi:hypothetical protein